MSQTNRPSEVDSPACLLPKIQQKIFCLDDFFFEGVKSNNTEHTLLLRHNNVLLSHRK